MSILTYNLTYMSSIMRKSFSFLSAVCITEDNCKLLKTAMAIEINALFENIDIESLFLLHKIMNNIFFNNP